MYVKKITRVIKSNLTSKTERARLILKSEKDLTLSLSSLYLLANCWINKYRVVSSFIGFKALVLYIKIRLP